MNTKKLDIIDKRIFAALQSAGVKVNNGRIAKADRERAESIISVALGAGPTQVYKLRAECKLDVHRLFDAIPVLEYSVRAISPFPDVEAEFKTYFSLAEIREVMEQIPDSHVMSETVSLKKDYTGKRLEPSK